MSRDHMWAEVTATWPQKYKQLEHKSISANGQTQGSNDWPHKAKHGFEFIYIYIIFLKSRIIYFNNKTFTFLFYFVFVGRQQYIFNLIPFISITELNA